MFGFSTKKIIIILTAIFLVLAVVLAIIAKIFIGQNQPVSLTYYSLWEDPTVMEGVISDYNRLHPNVKVEFLRQNQIQYKDRILSALQTQSSPDIVRIHSSWTPLFRTLLAPVPSNVMTVSQFNQTFYPAASEDLVLSGKIYALPLEIDGLVMFVNMDLLNKAGLIPATTWEDFQEQVQRLTVKDQSGRIQTAGTALGTTSNVDHWQDILALMFLQNGASINHPIGESAEGAITFYTDFVKKLGIWDETQDSSTVAFANGKVAYYFAPTWRYFDIQTLAKNGNLNFKIVPVPQISGEPTPVNQSSYWAEAVSAQSSHKAEAFEFLKYITSRDVLTKIYTEEKKLRQFGEPYSRTDLKDGLVTDPNVGPFIQGATHARSSFLSSSTWDGDSGINGLVGQYYENAVNALLQSGDAGTALQTVDSGMTQVLGRLGIASTPTSN